MGALSEIKIEYNVSIRDCVIGQWLADLICQPIKERDMQDQTVFVSAVYMAD